MARGKPFICWLSTKGHYRDVALYIGDEAMFKGEDEKWVRARIGKKRGKGFAYVARWGKNEETIWMTTQLKPIEMGYRPTDQGDIMKVDDKVTIIKGRMKGETGTVRGFSNLNMEHTVIIRREKGRDRIMGFDESWLQIREMADGS